MANWCHNVLSVSGPAEQLIEFAQRARPSPELCKELYGYYVEGFGGAGAVRGADPFETWVKRIGPLTFRSFVPEPPAIDGSYLMGWDTWRHENWGTKWDARFEDECGVGGLHGMDETLLNETDGDDVGPAELVYTFDTAWTPPETAVEAMASAFPALEFTLRYAEYGIGFAGEAYFADGAQQWDVELPFEEAFAPEQSWF